MKAQNIPAPVPVIDLKKIDKILKRDAKSGKLTDGALAERLDGYDPAKPTCESVGRCAIGALLIAAGFPLPKLLNGSAAESHKTSKASRLLKKEYGLLPEHIDSIETINDNACPNGEDQTVRYEDVMGLVTFAAVMQENGVRFSANGALDDSLGYVYEEGFVDVTLPEDETTGINVIEL